MKYKIKIDVVSDVVCPWCYIGKRRLEKAVDNMGEDFEIEIEYHPFELNPDMPPGGVANKEHLIEKFGGEDRYQVLTDRVSQIAGQEGIVFNLDHQEVSPNTRKCHTLIRFAKSRGLQAELIEKFFNAYFTRGVDLSNDENLISACTEIGLEREDVLSVLADESAAEAIASEELEISQLGISGVPFYIINKKYGISGAQTPEMFQKAFKEISNYPLLMGEVHDTKGNKFY